VRTFLSFAGQGAQYYQMGRDLYEKNHTFRTWLLKAEEMIQQRWGLSLIERVYDPSKSFRNEMDDIHLSHPALFAIQYAAAQVVLETHPVDAVFGFSLGEWVAMAIAGMWTFEAALSLIMQQVEWLANCEKGQLLVVFESESLIDDILTPFKGHYTYAIHSALKNHTLSMRALYSNPIQAILEEKKVPFQKIPVSYPFHSPWIEPLKAKFLSEWSSFSFSSPLIPCASCTKTAYLTQVDASHLWEIIRQPLQIELSLHTFLTEDSRVIDCSPNGIIKALIRSSYGYNSSLFQNAHALMSQFNPNSVDTLQKLHMTASSLKK
jgi:trans-AT polyketide synthase/acyltransferase/oxidoreductase domain-containing protein